MARTKKAAPVVEEEVDELDELEELEEEAPPKKTKKATAEPAKKTRRAASEDDEESSAYGAKWLCEYISEQIGKEYTPASLRVLLRRMARAGELEREVGVDRGRYEFTGPNDPTVKAILKQVKAGAIEKEKTERLTKVKADKAAKKAKADPEPDDDEDDDEEEEEKPAPKKAKATRRR